MQKNNKSKFGVDLDSYNAQLAKDFDKKHDEYYGNNETKENPKTIPDRPLTALEKYLADTGH